MRDRAPNARVRLFDTMSKLSALQKTLQPNRAVLRYRFQPTKLIRAKGTVRFREDWLRAFFPARHSLYQENPEDYTKFLLTTHAIQRLQIGPRGMKSWATMHQLIGHETRARKLLKLRFSRRRKRFETILQTTRRLPTEERAPRPHTVTARTPFFARQFSTYSRRGLVLTSQWIHKQKRFVSLSEG